MVPAPRASKRDDGNARGAGGPRGKEPICKKPSYVARNLTLLKGAKYARRPSAIARKANKRRSSDVLFSDEFEGSRDSWSTAERMPEEDKPEDGGWSAGPIVRELPEFKGPTPGPTNAELTANSSEESIMEWAVNGRLLYLNGPWLRACGCTESYVGA
ncbi:hypothetical protein AB1Y20_001261 [Prymnesium parvum]|uniref:Uncharacterized protein n=1 Tax=Prymnesium parvum TaxID=97485 RepID=A0AB34KB54_PRYPA|mmetsp:Transcript_18070/g.45288  ORF Transcript_18070/g.45288 Transcript_18070/m.45288 type:complete len:158 (+) Transcript_18070:371-844(+)